MKTRDVGLVALVIVGLGAMHHGVTGIIAGAAVPLECQPQLSTGPVQWAAVVLGAICLGIGLPPAMSWVAGRRAHRRAGQAGAVLLVSSICLAVPAYAAVLAGTYRSDACGGAYEAAGDLSALGALAGGVLMFLLGALLLASMRRPSRRPADHALTLEPVRRQD